MKNTFRFLFPCLAFLLCACEEEVDLKLPEGKTKIVVEGHIENGLPPFVILTKTISFLKNVSADQYENQFVHDAILTVSDGQKIIQLKEWCANEIDDTLKSFLSQFFESPALDTNISYNFCVYSVDIPDINFRGEPGKRYSLTIQAEGQVLTSFTAIPYLLNLDSLWHEEGVNLQNDSLVYLWARYTDPDTMGNYVRYFTKRNDEPFYPGYFGSVFDDKFVNGTSFPFVIDRGQSKTQQPDFSTYGYFYKGDTIVVKWSAIDAAHYNFWRTAEQEFGNGGNPFGTPTVIESNIEGGLGIWGGYASFYDTLVVSK